MQDLVQGPAVELRTPGLEEMWQVHMTYLGHVGRLGNLRFQNVSKTLRAAAVLDSIHKS